MYAYMSKIVLKQRKMKGKTVVTFWYSWQIYFVDIRFVIEGI